MKTETAFNLYWGLHLHFTSKDYSLLKYGPNTNSAANKFQALSPSHRHRFEWLAQKFPKTQDNVFANIGCIFDDVSVRFASTTDILDSYLKFRGRREAITHTLKSDVSKYELTRDSYDKIFMKYLSRQYSPEFMLLLNQGTTNLTELSECSNFSWANKQILQLIKYNSFFPSSKYIHLLTHDETELA